MASPKKKKKKAEKFEVHCAYDELVKRSELTPNPRNPNTHPENQIELLAKIIKVQGWRAPITVSRLSGMIVRGHGRLLAAARINAEVVPVDYQHYDTEADEMADLLADNRLAELAEINLDMLEMDLSYLQEIEFDLELTGFVLDGKDEEGEGSGEEVGEIDPIKEWDGMPEFEQEDKSAFRSIIVHFKDQEAVDQFTGLVGSRISPQTKYIWYPEAEIDYVADKRYSSES